MTYRELHLRVSPSMTREGSWELEIADGDGSPGAEPLRVTVAPMFTRDLLNRLRASDGFPNSALIRAAGTAVWSSLLPPPLDAALRQLLPADGAGPGVRLRLTASSHGMECQDTTVLPTELPLEVLFDSSLSYLAHRPTTLLSRKLGSEPDLPPFRTTLPLRMLVVTAMPTDLPDPGIEAERSALEEALRPATDQGGLILDFCTHATSTSLRETLQGRSYDILHFIGHGGFAPEALAGEPLGFFCLENPEDHSTFALDSETLYSLLLETSVRLVVFTACSTAVDGMALPLSPYPPAAFAGMAQRLISGVSSVAAVLAMQFDFETRAAPLFSRAFYQDLLLKNANVDEAVRSGRVAIFSEMSVGHRAWIAPALFARCEGLRVFELPPLVAGLPAGVAAEIASLDKLARIYEATLQALAQMTPAVRADPKIQELQQSTLVGLEDVAKRRAELLGDSLRLLGGRAPHGNQLSCTLQLRLRQPARFGLLSVTFPCVRAHFTLLETQSDAAAAGDVISATQTADDVRIFCANISGGNVLQAGTYPLANLVFLVEAAAPTGLNAIECPPATVIRDGIQIQLQMLGAALIVEAN